MFITISQRFCSFQSPLFMWLWFFSLCFHRLICRQISYTLLLSFYIRKILEKRTPAKELCWLIIWILLYPVKSFTELLVHTEKSERFSLVLDLVLDIDYYGTWWFWNLCYCCCLQVRRMMPENSQIYIEFFDVRTAEAALRGLNGLEIAGRQLKLAPYFPEGTRW